MNRLTKFGSLIWNHKKKTIFGTAVLAYGVHFAQKTDREAKIRAFYARQAKRYGQQTVSPTQRLGRITVLVNRAAKGGKAVNIFEKNALPLLHLAGFDVDVLKVKDKEEMESVARVLDRKDADCLYVVGGDGTVCRVLTGIFGRENGNSDKKLPLCIFPGGRHNKSLKNILPGIFDDEKDIRQYCESAMAIIENSYQSISPMKCEIINDENPAETKTFYLLSSVDAGWLEHCDQKQPKLWYWGALKSKIVYLWEFAKRYPEKINLSVTYQDFCDGCNKCREKSETPNNESFSWLRRFVGVTKSASKGPDFSKIENPTCGCTHEIKVDAANLTVTCAQEKNGSKLHFQSIGQEMGRLDAIREGWTSSSSKQNKRDESNDSVGFQASKIWMRFLYLPAFIQKLAISGEWNEIESPTTRTICLEKLDSKIDIFLPKKLDDSAKLEYSNNNIAP